MIVWIWIFFEQSDAEKCFWGIKFRLNQTKAILKHKMNNFKWVPVEVVERSVGHLGHGHQDEGGHEKAGSWFFYPLHFTSLTSKAFVAADAAADAAADDDDAADAADAVDDAAAVDDAELQLKHCLSPNMVFW